MIQVFNCSPIVGILPTTRLRLTREFLIFSCTLTGCTLQRNEILVLLIRNWNWTWGIELLETRECKLAFHDRKPHLRLRVLKLMNEILLWYRKKKNCVMQNAYQCRSPEFQTWHPTTGFPTFKKIIINKKGGNKIKFKIPWLPSNHGHQSFSPWLA